MHWRGSAEELCRDTKEEIQTTLKWSNFGIRDAETFLMKTKSADIQLLR